MKKLFALLSFLGICLTLNVSAVQPILYQIPVGSGFSLPHMVLLLNSNNLSILSYLGTNFTGSGANVRSNAPIVQDAVSLNSFTTPNIAFDNFLSVGGGSITQSVVIGVGTGGTNFTLLANKGKIIGGSNHINIVAFMGGQAGASQFPQVTFTNLAASAVGFGYSSVSNSWHWIGPNGTNPPISIPGGFELNLAVEVRGTTNLIVGWSTNAVSISN